MKNCLQVLDIDLASLTLLIQKNSNTKCGFILTKEKGEIEFEIENKSLIKKWLR